MTIQQFLFILLAATTLSSAMMVVTVNNLVHAALWLVATLAGIAVFFVFLSAGFLAVAQVVIYIGAIAILMIFAIMLTRKVAVDAGNQLNSTWPWAMLMAVLLFGGLVWVFSQWPEITTTATPLPPDFDTLRLLGSALVAPSAFVLPFELASILLLAALVGAIFVAWSRR